MRPQPTILVIPLNVSDTMLPRMLCLYNESHKEGIQTTTITTITTVTTTTNYRQIICLARVFETAAGQSPSVSRPAAAPMLWLTSRAGKEQEVKVFSQRRKNWIHNLKQITDSILRKLCLCWKAKECCQERWGRSCKVILNSLWFGVSIKSKKRSKKYFLPRSLFKARG